MEIYLIRHTTVNGQKGICYGMSDVELSATFLDEANLVKNKLSKNNINVFYSSPLKRCHQLAQFLADKNVITDERIKEINFGDWELKKWDIIEQEVYFNTWCHNFVNLRCPNGESFLDLYNRVDDFFQELQKKDHDKVGLIIHGGVIRSILCSILKMPLENADFIELDFGGITKINAVNKTIKIDYINR